MSSNPLLPLDYRPFGMRMSSRSSNSSNYRYGFNGQEKDDEIAGEGNSYTAEFWQYDPRIGRRWNQDPKPNPSISNYATFANNPIWYSDFLGDTVRTNQEGFNILNEGLTSTLGDSNPFGYDKESGNITFDGNFDKTKFDSKQLKLISDFSEVVVHEKITEVKVVNFNDPLPLPGGQSLMNMGLNGATTRDGTKVFLARDPHMVGEVDNPNYNPSDLYSKQYIDSWVKAPIYARGIASIHEVGGHARLRFTKPALTNLNHNLLVEKFETSFREFYKIGVYNTKRSVKKAKKQGIEVNIGDDKMIGGSSKKH